MPYSNATKQAFADALRKLLEQKPFAKISVSHICEECGMNRKSFYYHFKDKYDLVNWIFDTEITKIFSEEEWKNAGFTWDILEKICEYFYKHRTFYSKVLQIEGQNSFTEHFRDILVPVNRKFLAMVEEEEKGEDVNTSPEKWEWIKDMVLLILYYEIYKRRHSGRKGFIKF